MTWSIPRTRKKVRKLRGRTRTMSWGRIGQHRKSGGRGGHGAAGLGKHKKSWMLKYAPHWLGKRGFKNPNARTEPKTIDLEELEKLVAELRSKGELKTEGELLVVDLGQLGYDKLLGSGKVEDRLKVVVPYASKKAVEKVKAAGGEVIVTSED